MMIESLGPNDGPCECEVCVARRATIVLACQLVFDSQVEMDASADHLVIAGKALVAEVIAYLDRTLEVDPKLGSVAQDVVRDVVEALERNGHCQDRAAFITDDKRDLTDVHREKKIIQVSVPH